MLAARGVSLGLGGRINLSELNHLPKDKMMLDKMNRLKREHLAEQRAKQARLVVRKHVDSKTLWTACANVIVGVVIISIGLIMTVIGYFDSANAVSSDQQKHSTGDRFGDFGWLSYAMKGMQYIGPVFCGIGMFLMIIACVITLESRDRHAQVIQEESTELRRSRRYTSQQRKGEVGRTTQTAANGLKVMCARRHTHSAGDSPKRRRDPRQQEMISLADDDEITAQPQKQTLAAASQQKARKCHSTAKCPNIPPSFHGLWTMSDASTTDPMNEYAVEEWPKGKTDAQKDLATISNASEEEEGKAAKLGRIGAVTGEQPKRTENMPRRKSASAAVQTVNRVRAARGAAAPLVRVESLVELSVSVSGSPRPAKVEPKR